MTPAEREFEIAELRRSILAPIMSAYPDMTTEEAIKLLDVHVALSDNTRIKLVAMNLEQLNRRKRHINHSGENDCGETAWLNICIDALEGLPSETKLLDILH